MSTFIYFTEAAKAPVNRQRAEALGVGYAFDTSPASAELRGRTPSGGNGWLFADAERMAGKQLGYNQELQTWRRLPGLDVWVGYYNDAKRWLADAAPALAKAALPEELLVRTR